MPWPMSPSLEADLAHGIHNTSWNQLLMVCPFSLGRKTESFCGKLQAFVTAGAGEHLRFVP